MSPWRHGIARPACSVIVVSVGMGMFVALALALFHRWSATATATAWGPFVAGAFAGLTLGGVLGSLFCAKDPYRPPALSTARLVCALVGAALVGVAFGAYAPTYAVYVVGGIPWSLWGVPAGCGLALIASLWSHTCTLLTRSQAFGCVAGALGVAALLDVASIALPAMGAHALAYVEVLAAAAMPLAALRMLAPTAPAPAKTTPEAPTTRRLHALGSQTWKPLVGTVICLFIFGFTWDTDVLGVQLNSSASIAFEKIAGLLVAAVVLGALAWYGNSRDPMSALLNAVLPVLVVTFIVRPYFLSLTLSGASLALVGIARETGFLLFLAAAWLALTQAAPRCNVSPGFAAMLLVGSCGLAGLVGLYGPLLWGPVASYVGAILFTMYLVGIAIVATLGRAKGTPAMPDQTAGTVQADERFAELVQTHNLTPRETDIALYLRRGHSYAYIANALTVSENTVRTHVRNIYRKLGVSSREELIAAIHGEE